MTCQLIFGRRNTDRTDQLYESVFHALEHTDRPVYLILPEQSTFRHETYMESKREGRSLWNLEITSFRRLAERVIHDVPVDTLGRDLMIYHVLAERKEELRALKPQHISVGYVEDISAVLKEMSMNGVSPEQFLEKAAEFDEIDTVADLADKLRDIALIASSMEELGFRDEHGRLFSFAEAIRKDRLFADALFFFDDFFDFTAAEYEVLSALMSVGASMSFAFLCDRDDGIFRKTSLAVSRVIAMAEEFGLPLDLQPLADKADHGALGFLERNYYALKSKPFENDTDALELIAAENKRAEVRRMARRICDLEEQGYTPADIGICFRNISGYEKYIEDIFASYGISCFVDDAYSLLHHPVFRFCAGIFRVKEEKWSFPSVFALLKSGLFPMSAHDCDLLENYCLAHAIKGRRFYQEKEWLYEDKREGEDLEKVNALRQQLRADLLPFTERIKKEDTAANYSAVLWDFMEYCRCDQTVSAWCEEETSRGRVKKSAELAAGIGALCDMLDQLVSAFPDRVFTLSEYTELLKMGAAAVKVRTIPSELDSVEISILGQSRPSRKKIIFLGGVNEGVFPSGVTDGGFLNIADRDLLKEHTDFWVQDKSFYYESEDLLVYQGLTLASERLILSYSCLGGDGKLYPSPLIASLKRIFPRLTEVYVRDDIGDGGSFYSLDEVLGALPLSLRENDVSGWDRVRETLSAEADIAKRAEKIVASLDYTGQSKYLSPDSLKIYPGKDLSLSVSSIELFRRCPFSYFAKYGLKLRERKILQFAAPDLGNIFHEILCDMMQYMHDRDISWARVGEIDKEWIHGMVSQKINAFSDDNLFPEEHLAYISHVLGENLGFIVEVMAMQVESGDRFKPAFWEVPFGEDKVLPPYVIDVGEGGHKIRLNGIIDRVDVADKDGRKYFRIVDYKSSGKDLSMDDLYYGISPQLPVYSIILEQGSEEARPAGIFYQSMKDVLVKDRRSLSDEKLKEKIRSEMSLKGYIIGDGSSETCYPAEKNPRILTMPEYHTVRSHTEKKIGGIGKDIFGGRTEIRPYLRKQFSSCDHCPYGAVCGYEQELMGKADRLPVMKDSEAKERMCREGE